MAEFREYFPFLENVEGRFIEKGTFMDQNYDMFFMSKENGVKTKFSPKVHFHNPKDIKAIFEFQNSKYLQFLVISGIYNGNYFHVRQMNT